MNNWSCIVLLICLSWPLLGQDTFEEKVAALRELPLPKREAGFRAAITSGNHTNLELGRLHHELGLAHYSQGALFQAIDATEKALQLRLADEAGAGESLFQTAYNLGSFYQILEDYDRSFKAFQVILDRAPNPQVGFTLYRLGSLYRQIGEFQLSAQNFTEASKLDDFSEGSGARATLLNEWAYLYIVQDDPAAAEKAIPLLEESLITFQRLAAEDDYYAEEPSITLNRLGMAHSYAGHYQEALKFFERALRENQKCCQDAAQESAIYSNMGIAYRRAAQLDKALETHRHALSILLETAEDGKAEPWTALAHDNIATTLLDLKRYHEGLEEIQTAIGWLLPDFKPTSLQENPSRNMLEKSPHKSDLLVILKDKAALWQKLAREQSNEQFFQYALSTYLLCDALLDLIRTEHQEQQTKLYWREQARDMYQAAVRTAWLSRQEEMAFYFSEKSRAVLLLDGLRELNASSRLPESTRAELARLSLQIRYMEEEIYEAELPEATVEQEVVLMRQQYRQLLDSIELHYPEYYRQKYEPNFIALSDFQKQLQADEIWIEYFVAGDFTLALVIQKDKMEMVELAAPNEWMPSIDQYLNNLKEYDSAFAPAPAQQLYQYLLAPLQLKNGYHLTFVPDGVLSLIPFEALLSQAPTPGTPYRDWDFLLRYHEISYAYSVNSSNFTTQSQKQNNGKILAFAPMSGGETDRSFEAELELPQSRRTAEHIANILPTNIFLGGEANRHIFRREAPGAAVLHLATHAYLDHEHPEFSYFLLADSIPEERKFYVNELYNYQFQADLTVLSACETGAGKLQRGEGVASIGRAFAQNGSPNLAMSLWPVDEGATGNLLERYYQELSADVPKAKALQQAKLSYLQAAKSEPLQHPFRWAGIVYYGQDTPLQLRSNATNSNNLFVLLGVGLIAMVGMAVVFLKRRKTTIA